MVEFLLLFAYGLIFGSFASVLIYRSVFEKKFKITGRSFCPRCRRQLKPLDLIPILSYATTFGRCRYCHKRISVLYPILELIMALAFVGAYWWWSSVFGVNLASLTSFDPLTAYVLTFLVFTLVSVFFLVCLFVTDALYYALPDRLTIPAIGIVLTLKVILSWLNVQLLIRGLTPAGVKPLTLYLSPEAIWWGLVWDLLLAVGLFVFFASFHYLSKGKAMGNGDMRLGFLMGVILGWPNAVVATLIAFILGGGFAMLTLISGKKKVGQVLPLGPFLVIGTLIALFYGQNLWSWYWVRLAGF